MRLDETISQRKNKKKTHFFIEENNHFIGVPIKMKFYCRIKNKRSQLSMYNENDERLIIMMKIVSRDFVKKNFTFQIILTSLLLKKSE